jgi:RNA polymerase sigma-70 factor (ECF subfamily)
VEDAQVVSALRDGDENVFADVVRRYQAPLLRLAQAYVPSRAVAEEVVADTWLAVLNGIDRFEGRSSLKTWIFRILVNIAKTRGQREGRTIPFSSLGPDEEGGAEPSVEPQRFTRMGYWSSPPESWPEDRLLAAETQAVIDRAIAELPPSQRAVISLRDVGGWSAEDVRNVLDVSETNQRVLLHRARAKVRRAIDEYMGGDG